MEKALTRRRLLRTAGLGSIVILGGCNGTDSGRQTTDTTATSADDSQPSQMSNYINYVVPVNNQSVVLYGNVDTFYNLFPQGLRSVSDEPFPPMLKFPFGTQVSLVTFANFAFTPIGLNMDKQEGKSTATQEYQFQTEIKELIASGFGPDSSFVAKGSIVTDEIDQALQSVSEENSFGAKMTKVEKIAGYAVYESTNGNYTREIAVGESEIIVGSRESIREVIETNQGERATVVEQYNPLEWALTTAGDGQMVFGGYGPEGVGFRGLIGGEEGFYRPEVLFDANGFIISNTVDSDEISAELAAVFNDLSTEQRNKLEQEFGMRANDYSMNFDDDRVSASGTYNRDILTTGSG